MEVLIKAIGLCSPVEIGKRTLVRRHVEHALRRADRRNTDMPVVVRFGLTFRLDLSEEIDYWVYLTGWWGKTDCRIALDTLTEGDVVIDVGANIGTFALRAACLVGALGRVVAFEPNPRTYARLVTNARLSEASNVVAVDAAVGAEPGEATLFLPEHGRGGRATLFQHWLAAGGIEPLQWDPGSESLAPDSASLGVTVMSLDSFCQERGLGRVDFIKMDVEGSEPTVLAGAQEVIREHRPRLMVECNRPALAAAGWEIGDFLDLLWSYGYRIRRRRTWTRRLEAVRSANDVPADLCDLHCVPG